MKQEINKVKTALGKRIRELRTKQALSQDELAFKADIERSYMGRIERGEGNPSLNKLISIANALKVKFSNLLDI